MVGIQCYDYGNRNVPGFAAGTDSLSVVEDHHRLVHVG